MTATAKKWSYRVLAEVQFGGFACEILQNGDCLVRAVAWKGEQQPRIALHGSDPAAKEWHKLAKDRGNEIKIGSQAAVLVEFSGNEEFAQNLLDQWLTH